VALSARKLFLFCGFSVWGFTQKNHKHTQKRTSHEAPREKHTHKQTNKRDKNAEEEQRQDTRFGRFLCTSL